MDVELSSSNTVKWDAMARAGREPAAAESLAPLGATDFIDVQTFVWVTRQLK